MSQVSRIPLKKEVQEHISDIFIDTIARITNKKLMTEFLEEFLSPTEKLVLVKRLAVYVLLAKGYSYASIRTILHVSPPTISSASATYNYLGKGCKTVIDQLIKEDKLENLLLHIAEVTTGEFAHLGKGSGVWKELNKRIREKKKKKL